MADRFLPQNKLEKILKDLQDNQVESPNIDGKAILNLKELGDRATLIRHVSAIANTGPEGYLIIGIENKTWKLIGIPSESSLRDADKTQQQINQILAERVDPAIHISYRTYPLDGALIGVVLIQGGNPPYIVSIPDDRYGGQRSDTSRESYVYRGAIYIRRGADSVIANRQSEIFAVLGRGKNIIGVLEALVLIALVVTVGVGAGLGLTSFPDVYVPTVLGGVWGLLIGLLLNHRVREAVGRLPQSLYASVLRRGLGPLAGVIVGAWLSYSLQGNILSGKLQKFDPLSMGLLFAPLALVLNFLPVILVLLVIEYIHFDGWFSRLIRRLRNR